MNHATYQLRFLIGLAIALAYSYAAFEYKWERESVRVEIEEEIEVMVCQQRLVVEKEKPIPITYQAYKPEFKEATHEELQEALQEIIGEEQYVNEAECSPVFRYRKPEDLDIEICGDTFLEHMDEKSEPSLPFYPEVSAQFKGGMGRLITFYKKEFKLPKELNLKEFGGKKVFMRLIVKKDGSLTCFDVIKGVHPLIDAEVLRVLMLSPKWEPATHKGRVVEQVRCFPFRVPFYSNKISKIDTTNE